MCCILEQMHKIDFLFPIIGDIIGAAALIISVFIGTRSIKEKIAENRLNEKIAEIEKNNNEFNKKIQTVLFDTRQKDNSLPRPFKEVQNYYCKELKPLCSDFANASMEVTTGLYILEEFTKLLLKLREPARYSKCNLKKAAHIDIPYFNYAFSFLQSISYYARDSVSLPKDTLLIKKLNFDPVQSKLGGPKENYQHKNVFANINGIRYDPRYFLYYEFFNLLANAQDIDSYRAYANFLTNKIVFPVSKYLFEHKLYAPLTIKCKNKYERFPTLYLMGFKFMYSLGNPKDRTLSLYYVNLENWFWFEKSVAQQLIDKKEIEYYNQQLDSKFMEKNTECCIYPSKHVVEYKIKTDYSQLFYNKNRCKIKKIIKKLHNV